MIGTHLLPRTVLAVITLALLLALTAGCTTIPTQGGTPTPTPTPTVTTPVPPTTVSPTPTPTVDRTACTVNSDCVPEQCCHPTSCINKEFKGVCTLLCTMSCEGPIDCGAGHCGCVSGTCRVVPNPTPSPTATRGGYYY
ncbi:MAG: hypothetical protein LUQ64_02210 [Methanomicrobiales archaeon]|nr:hypothetical protein [Methanomicrobiales archaeon]